MFPELMPSTSPASVDDLVEVRFPDEPSVSVLCCCELGFAGFSLQTDVPVVPGIPHRIEFRCDDGLAVTLSATPIHGRRVDLLRYFSGWEFISDVATDRAVDALVASFSGRR
jgi:hypothetical protein